MNDVKLVISFVYEYYGTKVFVHTYKAKQYKNAIDTDFDTDIQNIPKLLCAGARTVRLWEQL